MNFSAKKSVPGQRPNRLKFRTQKILLEHLLVRIAHFGHNVVPRIISPPIAANLAHYLDCPDYEVAERD